MGLTVTSPTVSRADAAPSIRTEFGPGGGNGHSAAVGPRVRQLREDAGLSLRDLAERSGVSATTLSQVERGNSSPTLNVAERIASGLGLTLSKLLRLDESPHVVVSRAENHRRQVHGGHRIEELTPPQPGLSAEISAHELDPGAATGAEGEPPMHAPGSRETAVVLEGALILAVDGERLSLSAGDSVTFDADLPHYFANESDSETRFIALIAAGLRRG
ncbi:MAG: helix-turn-helix domain-containing protein [Solirubrobacterales bacterium]|nr:helix-turn-helix domain-containing protein [Solirubrobacterales bacterium]